MLKGKKCHIMRHPYLTLTVMGLAAVGVMTITNKVRSFMSDKGRCVSGMMKSVRMDENN